MKEDDTADCGKSGAFKRDTSCGAAAQYNNTRDFVELFLGLVWMVNGWQWVLLNFSGWVERAWHDTIVSQINFALIHGFSLS
ncbi:MAG: hypothetical protein HQL92_08350 [Magnetococcales bacterium]|nr:hypothetical protein [Magnetococcales bacterium]